jgi:hypothetical protein
MALVSFASQPLYPQGKNHWYHWIGGWAVPRAGLDAVEKSLASAKNRTPAFPAHSSSLYALSHPDSHYYEQQR